MNPDWVTVEKVNASVMTMLSEDESETVEWCKTLFETRIRDHVMEDVDWLMDQNAEHERMAVAMTYVQLGMRIGVHMAEAHRKEVEDGKE